MAAQKLNAVERFLGDAYGTYISGMTAAHMSVLSVCFRKTHCYYNTEERFIKDCVWRRLCSRCGHVRY